MRSLSLAGGVLLVFVITLTGISPKAVAQSSNIAVGEIPFPELTWGKQSVEFDITNQSDWLVFAGIMTEVGASEGSYTTPFRASRQFFTLPPGETTTCAADIDIPGNYGVCTVWVKVYELVDTLDDITLGNQVFEQPFRLRFHPPEPVVRYRQEKLSIPPMMDRSKAFDSEFYRMFLLFLQEGKSLDDMAHITNARPEYVQSAADELLSMGYISKDSLGEYVSRVPVISLKEAEKVRELVNRTSDKLVEMISANQPLFAKTVDSLVRAGVVTADGQGSFMEGSDLLFRPYPLHGEMLLWYALGDHFISGGQGLFIYTPHNLCAPFIGRYIYLVHGSDYFNGTHFYDAYQRAGEFAAYFAAKPPKIWCSPKTPIGGDNQRLRGQDWDYSEEVKVESFYFDTTALNPPLRALSTGVPEYLSEVSNELEAIHKEFASENVGTGVRFWFWNLTSTLTLSKLEKAGKIESEDVDMYLVTRLHK